MVPDRIGVRRRDGLRPRRVARRNPGRPRSERDVGRRRRHLRGNAGVGQLAAPEPRRTSGDRTGNRRSNRCQGVLRGSADRARRWAFLYPPLSLNPRSAKRPKTVFQSPRRNGGGTRGARDEQRGLLRVRSGARISESDGSKPPPLAWRPSPPHRGGECQRAPPATSPRP
jgi:hypothetical protein